MVKSYKKTGDVGPHFGCTIENVIMFCKCKYPRPGVPRVIKAGLV
jgi:hypothetical protein